jgi:hypothetical protein
MLILKRRGFAILVGHLTSSEVVFLSSSYFCLSLFVLRPMWLGLDFVSFRLYLFFLP